MSVPLAASRPPAGDTGKPPGSATAAAAAAVLGFFVITLDALVVNVALPSIRNDLGGGVTGLQWVLDGYTLMFAALLLSSGAVTDRIGARRAFGMGLVVFAAASAACGLAPTLGVLVTGRLVQGAGAAMMVPSSLTLIREAYPDPVQRGRAIAAWTIGGSVAAAAGPVAGGALNLVSWRLIFFINLPAGVVGDVPADPGGALAAPRRALRLGRADPRGAGHGWAHVRRDRGRRRRLRRAAGPGGAGGGGGGAGRLTAWSSSSASTFSRSGVCRRWPPAWSSCPRVCCPAS